ncbi:MAG TPA: hypothetical protein VM512_13720 [Burkholderiaceae bacterium]|nr:hypothetical protein [Burkholderiaceae bacterium]
MTLLTLSGRPAPILRRSLRYNAVACMAVLCLLTARIAVADASHSHDAAPAADTGTVLPRFTAISEAFELVGVVDGKTLTLYLDHAPDNRPVDNATLELELDGTAVPVTGTGPGTFTATLAAAPAAGETPVAATVVTGQTSDLLAGTLDIHADAHEDASNTPLTTALLAALGTGLGLLAAALIWKRISQRKHTARRGDAA